MNPQAAQRTRSTQNGARFQIRRARNGATKALWSRRMGPSQITHWGTSIIGSTGRRLRQLACPSEESIDALCGFAAFGDGPDNQRLAAAHIAGGEYAGNARHVIGVGRHVAARVERHAELLNHTVFHW